MVTVTVHNLYHRLEINSVTYYVHLGTLPSRGAAVKVAAGHLHDPSLSPEVFFGSRWSGARHPYICETISLVFEAAL